MDKKYNKKLVPIAKTLRKNMTDEEKHLWYDFLKGYSIRFYRQKVLGKYIADFYCSKAKLVIEIDGSQHYDDIGLAYDKRRTEFIEKYDLTVLRIPNNEIRENFNNVCEYIDFTVKQRISNVNDGKAKKDV